MVRRLLTFGDMMTSRRCLVPWSAAVLGVALTAGPVDAQTQTRELWPTTLARHFAVAAAEVDLVTRRVPDAGEVAVILFVARRSGASPDVVMALRERSPGWDEVGRRFGLDAGAFHLPLTRPETVAALRTPYQKFQRSEPGTWGEIRLTDEAIVTLVSVRVIARSLRLPPDEVMAAVRPGEPWNRLLERLTADTR